MTTKAKVSRPMTIKLPMDVPPPPSAVGVMNRHQVCQALGVISIRKFSGMISSGRFPRPDFRVGKSPRWSVVLFNQWVEANRIKPEE